MNWYEVVGCRNDRPLRLLVPMVILDELDRLKRNDQKKKGADAALSCWISCYQRLTPPHPSAARYLTISGSQRSR